MTLVLLLLLLLLLLLPPPLLLLPLPPPPPPPLSPRASIDSTASLKMWFASSASACRGKRAHMTSDGLAQLVRSGAGGGQPSPHMAHTSSQRIEAALRSQPSRLALYRMVDVRLHSCRMHPDRSATLKSAPVQFVPAKLLVGSEHERALQSSASHLVIIALEPSTISRHALFSVQLMN